MRRTLASLAFAGMVLAACTQPAPMPPAPTDESAAVVPSAAPPAQPPSPAVEPLMGRVVAVGIPGAGAVAKVGAFHEGGPIHDKPELAAFTAPGRVLDPERVLVASTSSFGAPPAAAAWREGAILSVDPRITETLVIPPDLGAPGGQAGALEGAVQLFTAQSPDFVNALYNPEAVTADMPAVGDPRGISLNHAFGRPWFANSPLGPEGTGVETVVDPDGRPLAGAPSKVAGGVFAGEQTNRAPQIAPGSLAAGAVGTALLGKSPDGDGRAVFAVALADGAIVQVHVELGVDGLVEAGTFSLPAPADGDGPARVGLLFNWVPDPLLFVSEPGGDAVVRIALGDDGQLFQAGDTDRFRSPEIDEPVDLAPAVPEVVSLGFSSNTTLAAASDLYVANRATGSVVRMTQDGKVIAVRRVELPGLGPLGPGRLNGIAVSADAQTLWLTVSGPLPGTPEAEGALVAAPAFGGPQVGAGEAGGGDGALAARGALAFVAELAPADGLGPLYNARSCGFCHSVPDVGGMGSGTQGTVVRVGRFGDGQFDPLAGRGGPVARAHAVSELGFPCDLAPGVPAAANLTSVRNAPALFGAGLVEAMPDAVIVAAAVPRGDGVHGRPNRIRGPDGRTRVGRFGWKADVATVRDFVGQALRNEHGITNPVAPDDIVGAGPAAAGCPGFGTGLEDDGSRVAALTAFIGSLAPPAAPGAPDAAGSALFAAVGCAACHRPTLEAGEPRVALYSDLLLHDVGALLDDGVVQGDARGRDWRTTPLWGLGSRARYLHDGRARTLSAAITAHGGEAAPAADRFRALSPAERALLLRFLSSL